MWPHSLRKRKFDVIRLYVATYTTLIQTNVETFKFQLHKAEIDRVFAEAGPFIIAAAKRKLRSIFDELSACSCRCEPCGRGRPRPRYSPIHRRGLCRMGLSRALKLGQMPISTPRRFPHATADHCARMQMIPVRPPCRVSARA